MHPQLKGRAWGDARSVGSSSSGSGGLGCRVPQGAGNLAAISLTFFSYADLFVTYLPDHRTQNWRRQPGSRSEAGRRQSRGRSSAGPTARKRRAVVAHIWLGGPLAGSFSFGLSRSSCTAINTCLTLVEARHSWPSLMIERQILPSG